MKKIFSFLVSMSLFCTALPIVNAEPQQEWKTTMATETINYTVGDKLFNYRGKFDDLTAWNGGTGWAGGWYPGYGQLQADSPSIISSGIEGINYIRNYYANVALNRKLSSPIDTSADGKYVIGFTYHETGASETKLLTLNDRIGMSDSSAGISRNSDPLLYAGFCHIGDASPYSHFYLQLGMNGQKVTDVKNHDFADLNANNVIWNFKLGLDINSDDIDVVRMKAWKDGAQEPEQWLLSVESEISGKTIDVMDVRNNGTGCCFGNIKVEKLNIPSYDNATKEKYDNIKNITNEEEKAENLKRLSEKGFFYEDFSSYAVSDPLWNHKSDYDSDTAWTGGAGWSGGWFSETGYPPKHCPYISELTFSGTTQNFVMNYLDDVSINRKLFTPVDTSKDGEYYLSFLYNDGGNNKNPIEIDTKFGLSNIGLITDQTDNPSIYAGIYYDKAQNGYFAQLGAGNEKILGTEKYAFADIYKKLWEFKMRISINGSGTDKISMKFWDRAKNEPAEWTLEMDTELSGADLDMFDFRNNKTTSNMGTIYLESYKPDALRNLYGKVDSVDINNYDAVLAEIGQFDEGLAKNDLLLKLKSHEPKELTELSFRFKDNAGNTIDKISGGETSIFAEWKFKNTLGSDKNVKVILAVYDDKALKTVQMKDAILVNGDITLVDVGLENLSDVLTGTETLKAFLWDFETLTPIVNSKSLNGAGLDNPALFNRLYLHVGESKNPDQSNEEIHFSTIEEARDYIKEYKKTNGYPEDGVYVYLHGGKYDINNTLYFDAADSGAEGAPVVYRSYPGEEAVLKNGKTFSIENDFKSITSQKDAERIDISVRDKVKYINLNDYGITDYGQLPITGHSVAYYEGTALNYPTKQPFSLIYNDQTMNIARWPNEGYTTISSVTDEGSLDENRGFTIEVTDKQRLSRWENADDMYMHGYWKWDWSDLAVKVSSVDITNGTIKGENPSPVGVRGGQRFYVYNLLEELDSPGEWYLDRKNGNLYFYPPCEKGEVTLSDLQMPYIKAENASHLTFENIKIAGGCNSGFVINNGSDVTIKNCRVSNTFEEGITLSGCHKCSVINSSVYNNGKGAISVNGGNGATLEKGENIIAGNTIHDYSLEKRTYSAAVKLGGVGNKVSGNKIYNGSHLAIHFWGNDNEISDNEIYGVLKEASDSGVIYTMRLKTNRGNRIVNNYFHDIKSDSTDKTHGIYCVYLDDMFDGAEISQNVFENISGDAVMINGGRDNSVTDNICVNVENSIVRMTAIGTNPNYGYSVNEAFLADSDLASGRHTSAPYSKYPHLAGILEDDPLRVKYNTVKRNVCYKSSDIRYTDYSGTTVEQINKDNDIQASFVTQEDPGFKNAAAGDFTLRSDSVVYQVFPDFNGYAKK